MSERIELCKVSDVDEGTAIKVETGDLVLAVFNLNGAFYVIDDLCTHGPGSLSWRLQLRQIDGLAGLVAEGSTHVNRLYHIDRGYESIDDKASVIEAFFAFAQAEQQREAQALITAENLNAEAAKRYISNSLKREYASENGTELNAVLPKMSPLNPQYLTKKQSVFQKIAAFVEKFKGVGGQV
mgnify:CR=1 FL=1